MAVVLFSLSHVFFPALTTLPSPPRAAFNPFFARRFKLVVFDEVDFLPRRFDGDFRAGFFLEDGRLADTLFFAALRLADFRVAAMAVSRFGVSLRPGMEGNPASENKIRCVWAVTDARGSYL